MAVTILETLEPEDLKKLRPMCAIIDMLNVKKTTWTDDQVCCFYVRWYEFCNEMYEKYMITGSEAEECKFSPFTGNIYIGSED